ncbi:MAG: hypothetical protein Q7R50_08035 [Dehalococcoidales bacterium]|nr:hypothetical protein [Dehalococcoidales bacterium]
MVSRDGLFNAKLQSGESFSYTFTQNGTFNLVDDQYNDMDGTVYVVSVNETAK